VIVFNILLAIILTEVCHVSQATAV